MREPRTTAIDWASLIVWPLAWALVYYALTLWSLWGHAIHPIQAMFLMFGMMLTALLAAGAAGIWLGLLARREREAATTAVTGREVMSFGAVSGTLPMTVMVGLYHLLRIDDLGALGVLSLVGAAGVAGVVSALATSGVVTLRQRAAARTNAATAPASH